MQNGQATDNNGVLQKSISMESWFNKQDIVELAVKLGIAVLAILAPIKPIVIATGFLVLVDFITGIWASHKRKEKITSFKMRRTIVKTLAYQSAVIVAFIIETYMIDKAIPITKLVASIIALTEGKSFFENLNVITGINFWNAILNKIQGSPLGEINEKIEKKD